MKTIDEHYKDWYGESHLNTSNIPRHDSAEACDFAKYYFDRMTEWIPVEEELPKEQGHYFVKVKNSFPKNCDVIVCEFYEDNKKFYCEFSDSVVHDAIAWRPIELK